MVYSYAPNNDPLYVSEGDFIQFKFKAPPQWNFTQTITVKIGDLTQFWRITTIPEDFTPDPFPFAAVNLAELSTLYTYADGTREGETITTVSGLTPTTEASIQFSSNIGTTTSDYSLRIDYNGDGNWDTGWIHTNGTQTVENGAKIQIRGVTSPFVNTPLRLSLVIGTSNETWTVTTRPAPQNKPEPFPVFTDLVDLFTNKFVYSEVIRIQGMVAPGSIDVSGDGQWAISSTGITSTNVDGYNVLTNTNFTGSTGTVQNGDYLQLRILTATTGNTPKSTFLSIADTANGSQWTVTTGSNPSTTPDNFAFPDVSGAIEDFLTPSDPRPVGGITGLGTSVPVELVSTTSSEVKIKINDASIGVFPATVNNNDIITLYARSSATFGDSVSTTIRVGSRTITSWNVQTNTGPDTSAVFTPPANKSNQAPDTFVSSAPVTITGINRPITIEVINGYNALISIDYDTPVTGPRTFDPTINTSFYLILKTSTNLNTPEFATVSVGTGSINNPFTWTVTTYATVPPSAANLGTWYSKKTEKFDGYPIGTVLPILKEGVNDYGILDGNLGSRYAGFVSCEGQSVSASQYWALFDIIGNTYGGNGVRTDNNNVITYTGNFNLPDYRNRRLCGVGTVDSSRGNSAALPVSTVGKDFNNVGAEGGYWYFDRVDSLGVQPLEQIQGPSTSDTGLNSQFFTLGTVRTTGYDSMTTDVSFSISGLVTAQIGPLSEITVSPPDHDHAYLSAIPEAEFGDPLIQWGPTPGKAMFAIGQTNPFFEPANTINDGDPARLNIITAWSNWLNRQAGFISELQLYYGDQWIDTATWVESNLPLAYPENMVNGTVGPIVNDDIKAIDFLTYWMSPASGVDLNLLQDTLAGSGPEYAAVVDTQPSTFQIDPYVPSGGQTLTHSHMLTENPVGDPNTDFTGGNLSGAGSQGPPLGSGLGAGVQGSLLTFQLWQTRTQTTTLPAGEWTNRGINEWSYNLSNGNGYWTSPSDEVTIDCPMEYAGTPGAGTGMILNITFTPYPSLDQSPDPIGDTRYKINSIVNPGQDYQVGDELSTSFWNNFPNSGNLILRLTAVSAPGTGGAAPNIQVTFTQSEIFMDMTQGEFEFSSNFKSPTPDVTMRPQRQVPIINPFHKTKYIIKAY